MIGNSFQGIRYNLSIIKDAEIDRYLANVRTLAITDLTAAMKEYREMTKYPLNRRTTCPTWPVRSL